MSSLNGYFQIAFDLQISKMRLRGRDILKTSKGGISLPNYGTSDKEYLQGPTGKWYSKIEARKKSDVNLATWIDRKYYKDNVWPVERIVDHRKDSDGKVLYLIKFLVFNNNRMFK